MKANVIWKDSMKFDGAVGSHLVPMDAKAPIGKDQAPTPKELVAIGMGGCTAMDVIALLKKHKQVPLSLQVSVDVQPSVGSHPLVFEKAMLTYNVEGEVVGETLVEAVRLSQSKFCGVSAMLSKAFPIEYQIFLNGKQIASGVAKFLT